MCANRQGIVRRSGRFRNAVVGSLLALLGPCFAALAAEPEPSHQTVKALMPNITAITLEHGCFGCSSGSVLTLRRDGTARYTLTGNARHGTPDQTSTSTLSADDFDALARLSLRQGFFELNESYDDPQRRDGPWTTTSVERGGRDKRVFSRDDVAPPGLKALNAAIVELKARMSFVAER